MTICHRMESEDNEVGEIHCALVRVTDGTTNPGVTQKGYNPFKGIQNPVPCKPDNPLKGIRNIVPNGKQNQWPRGLTIQT